MGRQGTVTGNPTLFLITGNSTDWHAGGFLIHNCVLIKQYIAAEKENLRVYIMCALSHTQLRHHVSFRPTWLEEVHGSPVGSILAVLL